MRFPRWSLQRLFASFGALGNDTRGLAMSEYIITVGFVGIAFAVGFFVRGEQLYADYVNARNLFLVPAL